MNPNEASIGSAAWIGNVVDMDMALMVDPREAPKGWPSGYFAEGMREHGCDNTSRATKAWARREEVPWAWLRDALEERGGFCDCEVLLNVLEPPD